MPSPSYSMPPPSPMTADLEVSAARQLGDGRRYSRVQTMLLLPTPAVEIEIEQRHLACLIPQKHGSGIPRPHVVRLVCRSTRPWVRTVEPQAPDRRPRSQHGNGLMFGDGRRQPAQRFLNTFEIARWALVERPGRCPAHPRSSVNLTPRPVRSSRVPSAAPHSAARPAVIEAIAAPTKVLRCNVIFATSGSAPIGCWYPDPNLHLPAQSASIMLIEHDIKSAHSQRVRFHFHPSGRMVKPKLLGLATVTIGSGPHILDIDIAFRM